MSIFTQRIIKIAGDKASMSSDIHIYRGNRNIELVFTITDHAFRFTTTENSGSVIEAYSPSHGYVTLLTPLGTELCSGKAAIKDDKLVFKITKTMIDEHTEVGDYDLVIDLYDEAGDALLTLPAIYKQIHILERVSLVNDPTADPVVFNKDSSDLSVGDSVIYSSEESNIGLSQVVTYNPKTDELIAGRPKAVSESDRIKSINGIPVADQEVRDLVNQINATHTAQIKESAKDVLLEDGKLYLKKSDGTKLGTGVVLPVGGSGGSVTWESLTGKPSTFTPSSHSHSKSDITDFPTIPTKTSELNNDSGYATKEYVDAQSVKKLTSTNEAPIVINDLADGIYDFGNSSFVKMFNSDTSVLTDNITGICVLYSVKGVNKRFLYVDYKLSTPAGVTYKYELNTSESTYKTHKYNSLLSLGGTSSSILVIKDEPLLVTGMCVTVCSGLKMLSTDDYTKTVSLGTGKKTLYMGSSTSGNLKTYHVTIINSHNGIIKATFVYDTSTNTTVSVDKQEYATKEYVDDNVAITKLKNTGTEYKLVWNEITNSGIYYLVGNWYYALGNKSESYLLISVEVDKSESIMEVVIHGLGLAMSISTLDGSILYENHFATEDLVLKKNNTNEYEPIEDYNPATKKYVDDKGSFSFNSQGELVVTIGGVTKTFVPKQ